MVMNCLIVDDEPIARKGLVEDIKEFNFLRIAGMAENAFQALQLLHETGRVDLIFLDIDMPGLTGLDFLKLVKVQPLVIITTAYPQFALDGFDMGVVDYLLKPISQSRLELAVLKAQEIFSYKNQPEIGPPLNDFIYLKCNGKYEKIFFPRILYIEAANNYVFLYTAEKKYMTYATLKGIEDKLPLNMFVRTHKSFLVSRHHIDLISGSELVVHGRKIPISRNFKNTFRKTVIQVDNNRKI
jgi:two-component system, LytTR family, response regulator